eukprot:TRINITY_DN27653_c0_g1_i1.p1 TRINITY_DN27653_c0_g1~~TRINITY_DN27653_c0_g1_i1.p1  ORF type:complete len:647 (+),score=94.92 TRINITY_DN27653_c0_g1_i1:67-2007(+)
MAALEGVGFSKSANRTFHDSPYLLTISGNSDSLCVEVEHAEDGRRWTSRFASHFIEEITQRTGNTKKFDVFVRMLLSALAQESDAVYLDVLTARDLEMLRRHANPQGPPSTSTAGQVSDKRYLILTYRAEWDKVHYPLPLPLEERSEEDKLRGTVARLRSELAEAKMQISAHESAAAMTSGSAAPATDASSTAGPAATAAAVSAVAMAREEVAALQHQNTELSDALRVARRELEQMRGEMRLRSSGGGALEASEAARIKNQVSKLQTELKGIKDESRQKDAAWKKEVEQSARELKLERQKIDRLQAQVRKLEEEKRALASRTSGAGVAPRPGRGATTSADRSRQASRTPSVERSRPPSRPAGRAPSSRASSVASSRDRTPSPAGGRGYLNRGESNGARPLASRQRGNSPGARAGSARPQAPSPPATLTPYTRANAPAAGSRRTPSPQRRFGIGGGGGGGGSRDRTPSPGNRRGLAAGTGINVVVPLAKRAPALSLRERPSSQGMQTKPASSRQNGNAAAGLYGGGTAASANPAATAVYGGGTGGGTASGLPAGLLAPGGAPVRPGSLFGLAADLGIGPAGQHSASAGSSSGGGGGGAGTGTGISAAGSGSLGVATAASAEDAEACDIDARLQALQSFLKQTKNIAS